jgi:dolichol-phosphate mannosyltransferase
MATMKRQLISIVIPVHDERAGLASFHNTLMDVVERSTTDDYEIIYCDDGSSDGTTEQIAEWHGVDKRIKLIKFSRNFGKENALTAGITEAQGNAVIMLDGDGQHPVNLLPKFVTAWKNGARVVIGLRTENSQEGWFKRVGSWSFHYLFNKLTGQKLVPGSTDFRLIDSTVREAFLQLHETDRITRGLIDWLGFHREYVHFRAQPRAHDSSSYGPHKLFSLAAHSFVSLTPTPLYIFGYLGIIITLIASLLGVSVLIEQIIFGDPLSWKFTGTAMLGILILLLVGIMLISQGILSLYISHMHAQTKGRPLYIIDYAGSAGIKKEIRASKA